MRECNWVQYTSNNQVYTRIQNYYLTSIVAVINKINNLIETEYAISLTFHSVNLEICVAICVRPSLS